MNGPGRRDRAQNAVRLPALQGLISEMTRVVEACVPDPAVRQKIKEDWGAHWRAGHSGVRRSLDVVTAGGAAQLVGCDPRTVRTAIRTGALPAWRLGGHWLIPRAAALRWGARLPAPERRGGRPRRIPPEGPAAQVGAEGFAAGGG